MENSIKGMAIKGILEEILKSMMNLKEEETEEKAKMGEHMAEEEKGIEEMKSEEEGEEKEDEEEGETEDKSHEMKDSRPSLGRSPKYVEMDIMEMKPMREEKKEEKRGRKRKGY